MKQFLMFWYFLLEFARVTICLRVVSLSVPALKPRGESATLTCEYELEGGRLYSVKWYRDNEEFYRYMPRLRPPQHAHTLDGVSVDLHKSSARRVHLRELTLQSRGLYRCEVSEEAPSFHSAEAEAVLEVYYFPREAPRVTGHERRYRMNEPLDVNCTSTEAYPAPDLQWHVDGQKVTDSWLVPYETESASQDLLVSKLGLRIPAKPRMRLRCIATIGTHKRERTVVIEKIYKRACYNLWLVRIAGPYIKQTGDGWRRHWCEGFGTALTNPPAQRVYKHFATKQNQQNSSNRSGDDASCV